MRQMNYSYPEMTTREWISRCEAKLSENLRLNDVMIAPVINVPTVVKQNRERMLKLVFEPLYSCFGDKIHVYSLNLGSEQEKTGFSVTKEAKRGEEMVVSIHSKYESEVSNAELFAHMYHWVPYDTLTWCTPFPEIVRCESESPLWIRVTLKKSNNRRIAQREYWEGDKIKTVTVYR